MIFNLYFFDDSFSRQFVLFGNLLLGFLFLFLHVPSNIFVRAEDITEDVWIFEQDASSHYNGVRLYLTVSARHNNVEICWENAPALSNDRIFLTKRKPFNFTKLDSDNGDDDDDDGDEIVTATGEEEAEAEGSGGDDSLQLTTNNYSSRASPYIAKDLSLWSFNEGREGSIILAINPMVKVQWFTTNIPFERKEMDMLTVNSSCYGYWASYVNDKGEILAMTCYRIYPTWMNDLRDIVGGLKLKNLMIPGTHDSGSYRQRRHAHESLFIKYSVTQDDDIYTQLLNGIRYLDLRVGYYRGGDDVFYINHGITKQKPLISVLEQIKKFILDTNEIVIVGFKEFPIGFGHNYSVHHKLVKFLRKNFNTLLVHPRLGYGATLEDIWQQEQNIILAYDVPTVVMDHPDVLFPSVEQRWANAQTWTQLEQFLIARHSQSMLSNRPVSDMAELTPDAWGVVTDRYGGLRTMADNINWRISLLYRGTLGITANIVSTDFYRGNNIIGVAMEVNRRKGLRQA